LSAFLSAGRSVTFVLQKEQKDSYDTWFPTFLAALDVEERKLLDFMNSQRTDTVHREGTKTQSDVEMMPLTRYESEYRPNNISWMTAGTDGPPGIPPAQMGVLVHYFEIEGKKEKVIDTSERYLALLEKMARSFVTAR